MLFLLIQLFAVLGYLSGFFVARNNIVNKYFIHMYACILYYISHMYYFYKIFFLLIQLFAVLGYLIFVARNNIFNKYFIHILYMFIHAFFILPVPCIHVDFSY